MAIIIIDGSHVDHVDADVLDAILDRYEGREFADQLFIESFEVPGIQLECGIHGPSMGDEPVQEDEVYYAVRGDRKWTSRMVDRPVRKTDLVTVIAGPAPGVVEGNLALYTTYGGPLAPREPEDPSIGSEEELQESKDFWALHALSPNS